MNFKVEDNNKGKPCILFDNNKYRRYIDLKNGDISWRCLGRTCRASIRSDSQVTTVSVTNSKHTGSHPVTLRRLSSTAPVSPAQSASPSPPLSLVAPLDTPHLPTSPCSLDATNTNTTLPGLTPTVSTIITPSLSTPGPTSTPHQTISSTTEELIHENQQLKEEVARLTTEMRCILDHSIENDARLLQFTTEVFAPPRLKPSSLNQESHSTTTDSSTQCDMPPLTDIKPSSPKDPFPILTNPDNPNNIINSLKTTIEVLEAEVVMLRQQVKTCQCNSATESWTLVSNKKSRATSTTNRFNLLEHKKLQPPPEHQPHKQKNKTKKPPKPKIPNKPIPNYRLLPKSLPFESVEIRGDSHARNIAGMTAQLLSHRVAVTGICKPGARLQQVVNPCPPPTVKGTHCDVLIAGTNDLAAGEQQNIYDSLERSIRTWPSNSRLVIATLPHRHDLPATHDINQETALVNAYIEELAARHYIPILDINKIQRRYFTRHGMHLRRSGKWRLAGLLVDAVCRLDNPTQILHATTEPEPPKSTSPGPSPTANPGPGSTPGSERAEWAASTNHPPPATPICIDPASSGSFTLPHDSYADAVKMTSQKSPFLDFNMIQIGLE